MLFAATTDGRGRAAPGARGTCPECGDEVLAKCGELVIWHWAHIPGPHRACSYGGETEWHLEWKERALERGCDVEKVVAPGFRADIVTPSGRVIELQSKGLPEDQVWSREEAYGSSLIWLVKVSDEQDERIRIFGERGSNGARGFYYRQGPKWLTTLTAPIYLDIDEIYRVEVWLKDVETEWGPSERLVGRVWEATESEIFGLPEKSYAWCPDHRSFFCPCVAGWLYEPPFVSAARGAEQAAAWGLST